jgi:hypothetical protein
VVAGGSLILGSLGSKGWAATVACIGLLYGAIGVFVLGVSIDLILVAGAIALAGTARFEKVTALRRRNATR